MVECWCPEKHHQCSNSATMVRKKTVAYPDKWTTCGQPQWCNKKFSTRSISPMRICTGTIRWLHNHLLVNMVNTSCVQESISITCYFSIESSLIAHMLTWSDMGFHLCRVLFSCWCWNAPNTKWQWRPATSRSVISCFPRLMSKTHTHLFHLKASVLFLPVLFCFCVRTVLR